MAEEISLNDSEANDFSDEELYGALTGEDKNPCHRLPERELPIQDTLCEIASLVEYYLSDEYLMRDVFLLKHVTKNREGYVSLKLLSRYRKIQKMTKDWRILAAALENSDLLEMNPECTRVRRKTPLPPDLSRETNPCRTLLAFDLPEHLWTLEKLAELFGKFGSVTSLQLHKPNGRPVQDVQVAENEYPGISKKCCALIQYDMIQDARQAVRCLSLDKSLLFKIVEMPKIKRVGRGITYADSTESLYFSDEDTDETLLFLESEKTMKHLRSPFSSNTSSPILSPKRPYLSTQAQRSPTLSRSRSFSWRTGSISASVVQGELWTATTKRDTNKSCLARTGTPGTSPLPLHKGLRKTTTLDVQEKNDCVVRSSPSSPWLPRRRFASTALEELPRDSYVSSPLLHRRLQSLGAVPDNVIRFPKGPDGTNGFKKIRSVPTTNAAQEKASTSSSSRNSPDKGGGV